ncbi:hypothetical protein D1AOALGA4SA_8229 [Olavius algarvensis Delta 1 endosymbiont]|nr:hypothetical protein D1AOALGA4SA_8229 [Olavius algarvensis Delta 1 endosymbiont]
MQTNHRRIHDPRQLTAVFNRYQLKMNYENSKHQKPNLK